MKARALVSAGDIRNRLVRSKARPEDRAPPRPAAEDAPPHSFTRRWCQGNFQHFWLIFGHGVRFGHRLYFANGILAYTSGPLLLLLMTLGLVQGLRGRVYEYQQGLLWLFLLPFLT